MAREEFRFNLEQLEEAWEDIKITIANRRAFPLMNSDRHPSEESVSLIDEYMSALRYTAGERKISCQEQRY